MGRSRGTSKEPAAGSSSLAQRLACVRRDEDSVAGSTRRRALFLSLVSSFSWIFTHRAQPPSVYPPQVCLLAIARVREAGVAPL